MEKRKKEKTQIISFRVSDSLIKKINEFARERIDEAGRPLNTSKAARLLVFDALGLRKDYIVLGQEEENHE